MLAILDAVREQKHQERRFLAAMQGVDIPEEPETSEGTPSFEDVVRRAQAKARGVSEDALYLEEIGFHVEEE